MRDNHKYSKYINNNPETRWARVEEIKESGTYINLNEKNYPTAGLPLVANTNEMYVDGEDTHSLIFGSTGSKKTRLFCLPMINLFAKAGESFIVADPKGEIYQKTSGLVKENGYKTIVLNFRDIGKGNMWNPLTIPYELYKSGNPTLKDKSVTLINDFLSQISEKSIANRNDPFWSNMSQSYLLACALLLFECGNEENVNVGSLSNFCIRKNTKKLDEIAKYMDTSTIAGINFQSFFTAATKTKESILITAFGSLSVFNKNENLTKMLSKNNIDIKSIGREKTAVYLIIPDEKTSLHFLAATFIKQTYEILIEEAQKEKSLRLPVRVNFLLDEFCNMPQIPDMPAMISAARSRNIRYFLIAQSINQLRKKYQDDAETLKGNCDNWVFLTSKELTLLNELSALCGSYSLPNGSSRNLISTSELQRLSKEKGEALILHARQYPFITNFPDIDDYSVFKGYEPVEMESFEDFKPKLFEIEELYNNLLCELVDIPFAKDPLAIFVARDVTSRW